MLVVPGLLLVVGVLAAAITFGIGAAPDPGNPAAITRMPIPSERQVDLQAKSYGLFFAKYNAPSRIALRAPPLSIALVPPSGLPEPAFKEVKEKSEVQANGDSFVQVATIGVRAAGRYTVKVHGRDENGGSLCIGDTPTSPASLVPALLHGGIVLAGTLALVMFLAIRGLRRPRG